MSKEIRIETSIADEGKLKVGMLYVLTHEEVHFGTGRDDTARPEDVHVDLRFMTAVDFLKKYWIGDGGDVE
jgi:hypothetical protein